MSMNNEKINYYRKLDVIRIICAIAILFYHLGYMSGGYLAVCTFFVLSGYLAVVKNIKDDNFSLKKYYLKSVLLGYNNYWQINANLDYFARHIDSPFMHLWYISILIQFDLVFPFIFMLLNKLKEKINNFMPIIIMFII